MKMSLTDCREEVQHISHTMKKKYIQLGQSRIKVDYQVYQVICVLMCVNLFRIKLNIFHGLVIMHQNHTALSLTSCCFALVSRKTAFHLSATRRPASVVTTRSTCKSVLFPTSTTGTLTPREGVRLIGCAIRGERCRMRTLCNCDSSL